MELELIDVIVTVEKFLSLSHTFKLRNFDNFGRYMTIRWPSDGTDAVSKEAKSQTFHKKILEYMGSCLHFI